jgi:hypothetical protein
LAPDLFHDIVERAADAQYRVVQLLLPDHQRRREANDVVMGVLVGG